MTENKKHKYDDRHIHLGIKISYLRKLRGWTQEEFAERVGISAGYLSQIEAPGVRQQISLNMLFAIAEALDVPASQLIDERE